MLKIPTREIYIYTGSQPLFVSDYGFSHLSDFPNPNPLKVSTNFTLIATNAPIIVFGELKTKNIMLITNQSISFV
jgi:hypothetical protein